MNNPESRRSIFFPFRAKQKNQKITGKAKIRFLLLSGLFTALLSGCAGKEQPVTRDVFAMDTYMTLTATGKNSEKALDEAEKRITELEKLFSVTYDGSDISRINNNGTAEISPDTYEIIKKALDMNAETNGALDITMYPLVKAWGFTTEEYRIPESDEISHLLEHSGCQNITLSEDSVSLTEDCMIDLGSLAKGYTGDEIMEIFREYSIDSAIINLGGNVQTLGKKPDGSLWRVAVRDPFSPDSDMCIVEVEDKAVITSGNYERFFIGDDGKSYWHIIDPSDGYPADNGIVSATVIGEIGSECDALSTALFVMGYEKAVEYWLSDPGFDMILVLDDGEIFYTEGSNITFPNADAQVINRE